MTSKLRYLLPWLLAAALVGIWWAAVTVSKSLVFPSPWQVVQGLIELAREGILLDHVKASLYRVAVGYGLATLVAIPMGILMGWFAGAFMTLNPIVQILRPISPIAWIPVAILWFGVGDSSPIFLIFLSSVFPMVVGTVAGVHTIEQQYIRAARNFDVRGFKLFWLVVLPGALPQIITGMRIGLGVAWLVVVAAEMIAITSGLGYMIIDARNAGNRYDLVVAGMIMIGVTGLMLDALMRHLEGLEVVRWRYGR